MFKTRKLKQKLNAGVYLVRYRFKIREGSPEGTRKTMEQRFMKEMSFKSGVKV